ncbi:MAG: AMP-dependent synthetase [Verrucomicrobia bacterium]|nr:AMP-dependent synthetase [Verrucomicrobiota bacterium]
MEKSLIRANYAFDSLGMACVRGLARHCARVVLVDGGMGGRAIRAGVLLGAGLALGRRLKREVPEERVGILLPPGAGGAIANLGCVLAGKTPVNVNFTSGRAAAESAVRQAGLRAVITAKSMEEKVGEHFPRVGRKLDLADLLKKEKKKAVFWSLLAVVLPASWLAVVAGIPREGGDREAGLLFTSGSTGEPKGVVLTHRNILSNLSQIQGVLGKLNIGSLLGCLPLFHSFGFTVTLWWPLAGGPQVVTYPSPLDPHALGEVISGHGVELLVTTPTFLRALMRRAGREKLEGLRMVVTGAEKLPPSLRDEFAEKIGVKVFEGYGMTEASPVVSVNVPGGERAGSVGKPVGGMEVRTVDEISWQVLPSGQAGILEFKGPNIFPGYLGRADLTEKVLKGGWYHSADYGRLDGDGFLFIEGRRARFSKVGGEMVPHGVVEEELAKWCKQKGHGTEGALEVMVTTVEDERKGESLVVLHVVDLDPVEAERALREAGLPNLWIPKKFRRVEKIPLLASGKLDLAAARKMAQNA